MNFFRTNLVWKLVALALAGLVWYYHNSSSVGKKIPSSPAATQSRDK